jgi:hypothetical protein
MENYSKVTKITAAIDARARPHRVRQESRITTAEGRKVTVLDTAFAWDKAKGCGR